VSQVIATLQGAIAETRSLPAANDSEAADEVAVAGGMEVADADFGRRRASGTTRREHRDTPNLADVRCRAGG
jgi:hypothetical protein